MCVWSGGGGGESEVERERTGGLLQSVRLRGFFSPPLILFHVMGLVLRRRNGTEKNTLLLLLLSRTQYAHKRL